MSFAENNVNETDNKQSEANTQQREELKKALADCNFASINEVINKFMNENITPDHFRTLTDDDLKDIGLKVGDIVGFRRKYPFAQQQAPQVDEKQPPPCWERLDQENEKPFEHLIPRPWNDEEMMSKNATSSIVKCRVDSKLYTQFKFVNDEVNLNNDAYKTILDKETNNEDWYHFIESLKDKLDEKPYTPEDIAVYPLQAVCNFIAQCSSKVIYEKRVKIQNIKPSSKSPPLANKELPLLDMIIRDYEKNPILIVDVKRAAVLREYFRSHHELNQSLIGRMNWLGHLKQVISYCVWEGCATGIISDFDSVLLMDINVEDVESKADNNNNNNNANNNNDTISVSIIIHPIMTFPDLTKRYPLFVKNSNEVKEGRHLLEIIDKKKHYIKFWASLLSYALNKQRGKPKLRTKPEEQAQVKITGKKRSKSSKKTDDESQEKKVKTTSIPSSFPSSSATTTNNTNNVNNNTIEWTLISPETIPFNQLLINYDTITNTRRGAYQCTNEYGCKYWIKFVSKWNEDELRLLLHEYKMYLYLYKKSCPFISRECYFIDAGTMYGLITKHVGEQINLFNNIINVGEVLNSLNKKLQDYNIIHEDLSPFNVLYNENNEIFVVDLEHASLIQGNDALSFDFEEYKRAKENCGLDERCDM